ncbi:hypothetical protein [Hyalangium versicolor]|uniref:hypothetical protein n=1 Tax=Hyalangium versicolor TaxID=2861190 RepID=UPI001CCFAAAF|nr:hypothetical protein [Hyalangium versicolor]
MNPLFSSALWLWAVLLKPWNVSPGVFRARVFPRMAAIAGLVAVTAFAEEALLVDVPPTNNPYIPAVAALYEQAKYEESLSKLEKALEWKSNGAQEELWLKLMRGVLQTEVAPGKALESFKEALVLNPEAELPVKASRRLRKLFEQARNTAGLPADEQLLAEELEAIPEVRVITAPAVTGPPPRRYGLSLGIHSEVDALGFGVMKAPVTPVVGVSYAREREAGVLSVLVQPSPGFRAEGQYHPFLLGWVRPYARLGATALFREQDDQGHYALFGGISARAALGADVQWNARMYAFADIAYERFVISGERYGTQCLLVSLGVGLFP